MGRPQLLARADLRYRIAIDSSQRAVYLIKTLHRFARVNMSIKICLPAVHAGVTSGSFPSFVGRKSLNHTQRGECLTDLVLVPLVTHI